MALANYMGSAPGLMSYQRQRRTDGINIPQRAKPAKQAPPYKEFDEKFEGNPGDKQFLYDKVQSFNSGLKNIYDKYGGEMDWVVADPEYRQLAGNQSMLIKDQQSAIQNRENTKKRTVEFETMNSGQSPNDYELVYMNGAYVPKSMDEKGGIKTKGDFLQEVVWNPQAVQHEDGTVGIGYTEFDRGTGTAQDTEAYLSKIFTGLGEDEQASFISKGGSQTDNVNLNFAISSLKEEGHKRGDNYDQVAAAADYLNNYGFDQNQKYYLYQQMYSDYENKRAINMPKLDEEGQIVRGKNGKPVFEDRILQPEDVKNPEMMKFVNRFYTIDRIEDFAKKYRKSSREDSLKEANDFENFDPKTGKPIEKEPDLRRWQKEVMDIGAGGEGFSRLETALVPDGNGGYKTVEREGKFRDDSNFSPGMEQAREAIKGKTLGTLVPDGRISVGGLWQTINNEAFDKLQVSDVLNVRQIQNENGNLEWVARVPIVVDEDSNTPGIFNFYDLENKEKKPVHTWGGWYNWSEDYADPQAQTQKVGGTISEKDVENRGWIINEDEQSWTDDDNEGKAIIYVDIPVKNQMQTWDQYAVGETREAEGEDIETGAHVKSFMKGSQEAKIKAEAGKAEAIYPIE